QTLWRGDFGPHSADGIYVPEPIGMLPPFHMWLQAKGPGMAMSEVLVKADGVMLASRAAEAICKLHRTSVPIHRTHGMGDELRILREVLSRFCQARPAWTARLERLLAACDRLGASVPEPQLRGIHRDFYPAQVLVDGTRLYLLDFDLF